MSFTTLAPNHQQPLNGNNMKYSKIVSTVFFVAVLLLNNNLTAQFQNTYKIGILLPFSSDGSDAQNKNAEAILDYYSGIKLALEDLERDGLKANVFVWDIQSKDSIELVKLSKNPDFNSLDVLVGPINQKDVNILSKNLSNPNLLWVSPLRSLSMPKKISSLNFFSPDSLRTRGLGESIAVRFPRHKYFIVHDGSKVSLKEAKTLQAQLGKKRKNSVFLYKFAAGAFTPALAKSDSFVFINALESQSPKIAEYKAIENKSACFAIGNFAWYENYSKAEEVKESKFLYPSINFISNQDSSTLQFSKRFIDSFSGESSRFGFQGYDHMKFIGSNLMVFGPKFLKMMPYAENTGLINTIKPLMISENRWFNTGIRLIQIKENEKLLYR